MSVHARPFPATVSVSPVSRTVPTRPVPWPWINVGTHDEHEVTTGIVERVPLEDVLLEIGWVEMEP